MTPERRRRPSRRPCPNLSTPSGDTPKLRELGAERQLERIVRIVRDPDERSEEEFAREVDRRIDEEAGDAEARRELRRRYGLIPVPPAVPVWTRILLDPSGGVWAEDFRPDWENRLLRVHSALPGVAGRCRAGLPPSRDTSTRREHAQGQYVLSHTGMGAVKSLVRSNVHGPPPWHPPCSLLSLASARRPSQE
ncbi:MAG: hypothetical protein WD960_08940 [Gemmatimonadota bacterium]